MEIVMSRVAFAARRAPDERRLPNSVFLRGNLLGRNPTATDNRNDYHDK
jgi:hypothetical protein